MASTNQTLLSTRRFQEAKNGEKTAPQLRHVTVASSRLSTKFDQRLKYQRIRELQEDATISFMRDVVVAPAVNTEWTLVANSNAPSDAKEFIEKRVFKHRLRLIRKTILDILDFGWAPFEKILVAEDGEQFYRKFKPLLHDITDILIYENTGGFAGYFNDPGLNLGLGPFGKILFEKNVLHVNYDVEGTDWYGKSVLKIIDKFQKKWDNADDAASRYDEKVSGSHWIVYFPVGRSPYNNVMTDNQEIANTILAGLESSGTVAIPDEIQDFMDDDVDREMKGKWRVELLSDRGNASKNFVDREKYLDSLKVRCFGLPERAVLEGKFGTKAEAETHADIGLGTIDMRHRYIVHQHFNEQIIDPLLLLNYGKEAVGTVRIVVAPLVDSSLSFIKEAYRLILQNPQTLIHEVNNINRRALRQQLGLEESEDDEEDIPIPEPAPSSFGNPDPNNPDEGNE